MKHYQNINALEAMKIQIIIPFLLLHRIPGITALRNRKIKMVDICYLQGENRVFLRVCFCFRPGHSLSGWSCRICCYWQLLFIAGIEVNPGPVGK